MQTTVSIPGISCSACEKLIRSVSEEFPDITALSVDLGKKLVTVNHADTFDVHVWARAVEELGPTYAVHVV